jgi:myo-inositol-1(or 4)-monophosphatase
LQVIDALSVVARAAGALAMERYQGVFDQWEKSPGNPVSDVDLAVDQFLKEQLRGLDPDAGWLSEETADSAERLMRSRVWVVDPIDGTRDFVRGRPGWCVSIALVEGGQVNYAVLDAPARGEHWVAQRACGATRNGDALVASTRTIFTGARVPADVLPKTDADLITVDKPNSIALRVAMVAADEADLVVALRWGNEWDVAAAALIASEAGAQVTNAYGAQLRFNETRPEAFGLVAASKGIHADAVSRLKTRAALAALR